MQGLQASFSRPLRVRSAGAAEAKPVGRGSASRPALVVDAERPITTAAFADVGFALGSDNEVAPRERDEALSRALNVIIAAVALVVLAPLIALIAIAIKLSSRGPVLYSQTRVGVDRRWRYARKSDRRLYDHGGRLFTMYKFRTMQVNAEADGQAVWASKSDPRVTLVGRFLRGVRLDEVPQLWNVLRGDMNIVGPRPERPTIVAELRRHIPEYQQRHRVKPGITGWAQVNGYRGFTETLEQMQRRVEHDLYYIDNWSFWFDLRIIVTTLFSKTAYTNAY